METQKFDFFYNQLNLEQKKAVETIQGPVLVIAGPGTGKTQVLTLRIANILRKTDTDPQNILALTFTDKAAWNMRNRLAEFIGATAYKVNIATFHSFANEIIQSHPEKFAFKGEMEQIDDLSKYKIIQEILDRFDPSKTYKRFISYFEDKEVQNEISNQINFQLKPLNSPYHYQKTT